MTGAPATGIERLASGWRVHTPRGTFEADRIVNAAGAWADRVAAMAGLPPLGLAPAAPLDGARARAFRPLGLADGAGRGRDLVRQARRGRAPGLPRRGGPGRARTTPGPTTPCSPRGSPASRPTRTSTVTRLLASWAGLRTFAPDRQLVIGPDPLDETFLWCAGQGGYGFQTACAASLCWPTRRRPGGGPRRRALAPRLRAAPAPPEAAAAPSGPALLGRAMLSYQHAYHAGNLADVHKHALLAFMLAAMAARRSRSPTSRPTRAGASTTSARAEAGRTGEAAAGHRPGARLVPARTTPTAAAVEETAPPPRAPRLPRLARWSRR